MSLARRPVVQGRTRSVGAVLAVATAGLVGLQLLHPAPAGAVPAPPPSAAPAGPVAGALPAGPTAVDDVYGVQVGGYYPYYLIPYAANDRAGAAPLRLGATTFADDQPPGTTVGTDRRSVGFADVDANVSMQPDGRMFVTVYGPRTGSGTLRYRVVDTNGATAEALATLVVGPGGNPVSLGVRQGFPGSVDVLAAAMPGRNADGTPGTIDPTSVHFTPLSDVPTATVSADRRTLTHPGWGVFRADPVTGVVSFVPEKTYRGHDDHISYVARDTTRAADGTVQHHSFRLRIYLAVSLIDPQPVPDTSATPHHASVTLPGVTDDLPGDPASPLRRDLTVFVTSGYYLPDGSRLYGHGRGLEVAGEGWWTLDAAGTITFTPVASFVGWPSTVYYQLTDVNGGTARGYEQVWVAPGPAAKPDAATTAQDVDTVVDAPKNDGPGLNADGTRGSMDRTSVHFPATGQPSGATLSVYDRVLTVPGQGVYSADRLTGTIRFDPEPGFAGKAGPVTYSVRDTVHRSDGRLVHNLTTSTLVVTVTPAQTLRGR